jgi:hypothetical protein
MADPRRMAPEEQDEAHTLLVEAVSDPDWQAARQALDELMRKLLVVHRLLEAEERLAPARAASRANVTAAGAQAFRLVPVHECGRCPARPPRREPPALACRRPRARPGQQVQPGSRARA